MTRLLKNKLWCSFVYFVMEILIKQNLQQKAKFAQKRE